MTTKTIQKLEPTRTGLLADTLQRAVLGNSGCLQARYPDIVTSHDWYMELAYSARVRMPARWVTTVQTYAARHAKIALLPVGRVPDRPAAWQQSGEPRHRGERAASDVAKSKIRHLCEFLKRYGVGPIRFARTNDARYERHLTFDHVVDVKKADLCEQFEAAAHSIRDIVSQCWLRTDTYAQKNSERVYYLSMEFLLRRPHHRTLSPSRRLG